MDFHGAHPTTPKGPRLRLVAADGERVDAPPRHSLEDWGIAEAAPSVCMRESGTPDAWRLTVARPTVPRALLWLAVVATFGVLKTGIELLLVTSWGTRSATAAGILPAWGEAGMIASAIVFALIAAGAIASLRARTTFTTKRDLVVVKRSPFAFVRARWLLPLRDVVRVSAAPTNVALAWDVEVKLRGGRAIRIPLPRPTDRRGATWVAERLNEIFTKRTQLR